MTKKGATVVDGSRNKPLPWWVGHKEYGDAGGYTAVERLQTSEEMLTVSGLNYELLKQPIYTYNDLGGNGFYRQVDGKYAIVRGDTGQALSVVGARYDVLQRPDAFRFFDEVVRENLAMYDSAIELDDGRIVAILAELPQEIDIAGWDKVKNKLLLVDSCDGSYAFRFFFTPIRVICENTLSMAANAKGGYWLKHVGINNKISAEDAREAIGLAQDSFTAFGEKAQIMAQTPISAEEIEGLMQRLFPIPSKLMLPAPTTAPQLLLPEPRQEMLIGGQGSLADLRFTVFEKREVTADLIRHGIGNKGETRWDAYNGVTEVADYVLGTDRKRTENLLFGDGAKLKMQTWDLMSRPGNWWESDND